ncbi:Actin [Hexamita inflata]|uniref:Actin n=1 Tax=Hexamita inflata TaxID=28002 RepID=A0AA86PHZ2_9EUKA|nr:Actin [Hexamita inflata]
MLKLPAVVCDHGTGFTKLGFAGQQLPSFMFPTCVTKSANSFLSDLTYKSGQDAVDSGQNLIYPLQNGIIQNWDALQQLQFDCFNKFLHITPQEHEIILTEPPMNAPENRERLSEIMFESFNFKGMFIGAQALFAIFSKAWDKSNLEQTGICLDIGDGVSHVIPVYEGYVMQHAVQSVPIAGKAITQFVQDMLSRREKIQTDLQQKIAKIVKEKYCYCANQALAMEFMDFQPINNQNICGVNIDIGQEAFIAPEIFFDPSIYSKIHDQSIAQIVFNSIQHCPIDCRKTMYENIYLSGGSTILKGFSQRLQNDIQAIVDSKNLRGITVNVKSHSLQRTAVFSGASIFGSKPEFKDVVLSKQRYDEEGKNSAREFPLAKK